MFDFLKQKIKQFFVKEEAVLEKKVEAEPPAEVAEELPEGPEAAGAAKPAEEVIAPLKAAEKEVPEVPSPTVKEETVEVPGGELEVKAAEVPAEPRGLEARPEKPSFKEKITGIFKREKKAEEKKPEEKRELAPRLSLTTKLKKAVLRRATIKEADVESLLWDLNIALLEADVAVAVAQALCDDIKARLVGKEISASDDVRKVTRKAVEEALRDILRQEKVDIVARMRSKKPYVVLFLGPNGHGKSTTIGKFATFLRKNGISCVLSASDTFRAASIEQLETIAGRAGVRVIKQKYGADPAAVAFDAIEHAKAHDLDAVLIDSAGRSELNVNLMEQMRKIVRVAKPDLKIYVAEALAGNAAVDEATKFNDIVGLDGIIVTKVDCDVKGGSLLSMSHMTKKPVIFIGTGQGLDDLEPFEPEWFIERVLGDGG